MGLGLRSLSKRERSWVLYDVGNSAYVMLAATLIPIYFSAIAEPGSSAVVAWGYATTVASLALALLMPFLGSLADLKGNKKKFLAGTIGTGAVSLAVMGVPGNAMVFLAIYVFSSVMLNASLVFYDAFLVDATEQDRYDEVSSQGYAWGYIGSCIPFIVCLVIVLFGSSFGIGQLDGIRISFVITAAWWLVFSVPVLRDVHQTHFKAREEHLFRHTLKGLVGTCKKIARDKRLLMYMLAFFFYIDGVHTIITMSTSYGTDLGIDSTQLVLALLVTQFVAFPSAIAYGRLAGRFGTKRMLLIAVFAYFCITLFAAFFLRSAAEFWVLAVCVGLFQGGIQALSRSEFGKLIPKENANEYYGFFDIFGKYATIMGTLLVSVFTQLTGSSSYGVLSVAVLFIVGFVLLWKMPEGDAR
ncbi:MAG: MFS transporter [Senegalimassilia anaerobia]|uniref:MFS transporter n=1 Tax=Senegalimassilia anaerobia TaxID=1473216 RepID=UPI002674F7A3|nr:MFS transporter [Senegalimassilia anaerobia]MEE0303622.1 MFS transporter [Senegalimassilia anaerobia]